MYPKKPISQFLSVLVGFIILICHLSARLRVNHRNYERDSETLEKTIEQLALIIAFHARSELYFAFHGFIGTNWTVQICVG